MSRVKVVPTATMLDFCGALAAKQAANVQTAVLRATAITPPFEHYSAVGFLVSTGGYPERQQLPYDLSAIDEVIDSLAALRSTIINSANTVSNPEGNLIKLSL